MSVESVMPSNHLVLCLALLLLPSIFPSIRIFSNVSALHIRRPKFWSFSFSTSPSNDYLGLIPFRIDSFDLLAIQGILKSFLQNHSLKWFLFTNIIFVNGWKKKRKCSRSIVSDSATPWTSLPGSSVHVIFQARVLGREGVGVAISFFRGSSQSRDWTLVSYIAGRHFAIWDTRKWLIINENLFVYFYLYSSIYWCLLLCEYLLCS